MSRSSRINSAEIIDVDALPEWNHSRFRPAVVQQTAIVAANRTTPHSKSTATIDLTNMDDSDSDISILSATVEPGGSGTPGVLSKGNRKETNFPSAIGPAAEKIRVCSSGHCLFNYHISHCLQKRGRLPASLSTAQSYPQTHVPPAKKLKLSTPPPAARKQPTDSAKLANDSNNNTNNNEPFALTSTIAKTSMLSLSDFSKLSQGILPQNELAEFAQTLISQHLLPSRPTTTAVAGSSGSSRREEKGKRNIACIELSSDGEEVIGLLSPKKVRSYFMFCALLY